MNFTEYNLGDKVLYKDEEYKIFWIYGNGYIEISKDVYRTELVHINDVTFL
ncbi:hypothetical protein HP456_19085 [Bacillus haikouensis]|jgi:hypothetical protein|uniref:hypothetical protein n=1 Tax=Bacillus haikouensis TaxID=1510468 RepID=UPI0015524726|nr:hypothetical protein [Bacillus haikouensis]NQD68013.1 hypothetical protein [Bacillus haikouensis]